VDNGLKFIKQISTWEMCLKKDIVHFVEMFIVLLQMHWTWDSRTSYKGTFV